MSAINSSAMHAPPGPSDDAQALSRFHEWIPTLLSLIAGMVDLTGFLSLGNLFTAHITGNLAVIGALVVRGGRMNPGQVLAIPVFMTAVTATWLIARASGRRGPSLMRLLLLIQFLLITCLLIFSVITKPSVDPHGLMATIAAMIAINPWGRPDEHTRVPQSLPDTAFLLVLETKNTCGRSEEHTSELQS